MATTSPSDAIETVAAGSAPGSFSITSTGEASFVMPLISVPGRAGVEPHITLAYSSAGGDGILGRGFSITGASAITRCPSNLARDGEIREVRYDALDQLCLDSRRLVVVGKELGGIEYRTLPDTHVKVIGRDPDDRGVPRSFEVLHPSGLVVEYGTTEGTRPRGPGGVPRAWLAAVARDGRGNAMDYGYCFADAGEYTAEYALDEIKYTRFEGSSALEATRAVKFVYGTKDPEDIRTHYSRGMALQSSLRLEEIQMIGPGNELVRRYPFTYELSPTTNRTLLTQVEECAGDVCKPPTRFQYKTGELGFAQHTTSIAEPTSHRASPILVDINGDALDDLVIPDTDPALSTPGNPITKWFVARNDGKIPFLASTAEVFSQEWIAVDDPTGVDDLGKLQPELGTVIDYNADGLKDILLYDVYDILVTWQVLLAKPNGGVELLDTGLRRPFPLKSPPSSQRPTLTREGGSMHLADVTGDHVPDLIQCEDHDDSAQGIPGRAVWKTHVWRPKAGEKSAGFDPQGERIEPLEGVNCDRAVLTVDINADSKVDLLVQPMLTSSDGSQIPITKYDALTRREDGTWDVFRTRLPVPAGRVLFVDINADGLPDAVESGSSDGALWTYINIGGRFAEMPILSLGSPIIRNQDAHFRQAVPLDYNG
ncbi:MAG: type IV secretion protein Rhs, partial [Polyangiaceae bacterium]|nr:type IV secretion protein Rhs [Polyangiaceae bacterium]